MKILADMGVSKRTCSVLRDAGHEVVHLADQGLERADDSFIVEKARLENSVIVTFDLDFGDLLAAGSGKMPSAIVFRLKNATPAAVSRLLLQVVDERSELLEEGAIILIEDFRYRVRRLPINEFE